jgi:protein tyrosine phosphatase (PTP) superfamily phosphohydrolase (DUF442 family)/cytochrome c556
VRNDEFGRGRAAYLSPNAVARMKRLSRFFAVALIGAALPGRADQAPATPFTAPGLHNTFRVTDRLISGGQPKGDVAFAELARLGVKIIVSVDGAKPDVAAARKHGLRYVHLPIGYDGVSAERVAQLTRAAALPDGRIFVHCHHGKHRGPAAVAVMCAATAGWSPARAEAWLRQAGTADEYAGLYRAVREFRPASTAALASVGELPEVAKTPPVVDAMVALDECFDLLKAAQKSGWKATPANAATLLWEQLRELARADDTARRPSDYRTHLADSERAAELLRRHLRATPPDPAALDAAFKTAGQSCAACHKAFRNAKK